MTSERETLFQFLRIWWLRRRLRRVYTRSDWHKEITILDDQWRVPDFVNRHRGSVQDLHGRGRMP